MKLYLIASLILLLTISNAKLDEVKGRNSKEDPPLNTLTQEKFIPTKEWQTIKEGKSHSSANLKKN
jgi:hypothetical protein